MPDATNYAKSVLVVQIDKRIQDVLRDLLRQQGCESTLTNNLRDAREYLKQGKYNAIISGAIFKEFPEGPSEELWRDLHQGVQTYAPEAVFILYAVGTYRPDNKTTKPEVHYIPKDTDLDKLVEQLRQLIQ